MADQERWQMSDSAAEMYEVHVASWFEPWAVDLVRRAGLEAGWRVLDVACGTGIVTRAAGPVVAATGTIVATDLNDGMLAEAQRHAVEGATVEWRTADATDLPFGSASFDAVLCQQGLQFVPDKALAVSEMMRVLRQGGVGAVNVWCSLDRNPWGAALVSGLGRYLSVEAAEAMAAPFGFGDPDRLAKLFSDAGFANVRVDAVEIHRKLSATTAGLEGNMSATPLAAQVRAMDAHMRAEMVSYMLDELGDHRQGDQLSVPGMSNVVIATA